MQGASVRALGVDSTRSAVRIRLTASAATAAWLVSTQRIDGLPEWRASPHLTVNAAIMPALRCSAMWQCSIQRPGFDISTSSSTVSPAGMIAVSFHTRFSFGTPSRLEHEEALAVQVDRDAAWRGSTPGR